MIINRFKNVVMCVNSNTLAEERVYNRHPNHQPFLERYTEKRRAGVLLGQPEAAPDYAYVVGLICNLDLSIEKHLIGCFIESAAGKDSGKTSKMLVAARQLA